MTVRYTIEAKPTTYNGVNFRSRLEARWAAYFDLMEHKWTYEPIDLGKWSPDFAIWDERGNPLYVEIKPITKFDKDTGNKIVSAFSTPHGAALCGLTPKFWWLYYNKDATGYAWHSYDLMIDEYWNEAGNVVQWCR